MLRILTIATLSAAVLASSCRASGPTPLVKEHDDAGDGTIVIDGGTDVGDDTDAPEVSPHALLAVQPPHGPFSGGTRVLLRGNGFDAHARVWFGDTEIDAADVLVVDAHRIQITAPPGEPGLVDVAVQNGDDESTRVALSGGYAYDAVYADPSSGPTSGGTLVTLHGENTHFDATTQVSIDENSCEVVEVKSATELVCRAPAGTPGVKPIRVTESDGTSLDVLDAFTYGDTDNGYRGGLSGDPLSSNLKVLVFDSVAGNAIGGASVILGSDGARVSRTDKTGVAAFSDDDLGPAQTVTVAAHCFQPVTFVDVPVDSLTIYLDPVLSPDCFNPQGDLESGGGTPVRASVLAGELVWPASEELGQSPGWNNVPPPKSESEHQVAYVFQLASDPTARFSLPSASDAVTPITQDSTGYRFTLATAPGSYSLYALAGIENDARVPPVFTPYAMGLVRGVSAPAGRTVDDVFIRIDVPLDQSLTLSIDGPEPTSQGPDRLQAAVAVRVGAEGYAILPQGNVEALLGSTQTAQFVGVPALSGSLAGTSYVTAVSAVTGKSGGMPMSTLAWLETTATDKPIAVGPFVEVPVLTEPEVNGTWNGRDLRWSFAASGLDASLAIVDVETAGGLYDWRIVAPGDARSVELPDLGAVNPDLAWPTGQQTIVITRAQIKDFQYSALRYRDITDRGWTAYAANQFLSNY
jgi:hypothetical protein